MESRALAVLNFLFPLLGCALLKAENVTKKPHIVFMIVDDLGWNDVSFHGSKQIPTPNIDAIAYDGIILNQYYTQPTCSPSRGALMTGKYPFRFGFQHQILGATQPWGLPLKERLLPQYLKDLDYETHAVGKWHLGFYKKEYLPQSRGFDSFFGYWTGVEDYYNHFAIAHNFTGLDLHENMEDAWQYNGTYGTELFTQKAKKVIQEHNPDRPMFLYFAQQSPHSGNFIDPLQCPENYTKPLAGISDSSRHIFAGMVSSMDHSVGEIFEALSDSGMLDNTIFIFTTDNGGATEGEDGTFGSNYPLKGSKYNLWEGGVRGVSFIWSPLLRNQSRIYNELMHITDWLPTLMSAAGGPEAGNLLKEYEMDGVDQWSFITDVMPSSRTEILLNIDEVSEVYGIRRGNYKLLNGSYYNGDFDQWYDLEGKPIKDGYTGFTPEQKKLYEETYMRFLESAKAANVLRQKYGKEYQSIPSCPFPKCKEQLKVTCGPRPAVDACKRGPCLFNITNDPCEFHNLAEQFPEVVADLQSDIDKYKEFIMPAGGPPPDPASNPKLHGNVWIPWQSPSSDHQSCSVLHVPCSAGYTGGQTSSLNCQSIIYYICIFIIILSFK